MRCKASGFGWHKLQRLARAALQHHTDAVLHALHCPKCGVRLEAEALLLLAGWSEEEWLDVLWEGLRGHAESA